MSTCFCVGPQNGQPVCPCRMRNVVVREGRYVEETDLGAVKSRTVEFNLELNPLSEKDLADVIKKSIIGTL